MGTPGWGKFFSEKNLVGKYFFELDFVGDPSILGEIPFVKDSQFKWKIEGSRTKSSSENNFATRFFLCRQYYIHPTAFDGSVHFILRYSLASRYYNNLGKFGDSI